MTRIRGRRIPPIDSLTDPEVLDILRMVIEDAKNNIMTASEHEQLEFKEQLNFDNQDELRKDFAAFANTDGGILAVGVNDKTVAVMGVPEGIDDDRLRQVLSAKTRIQPAPDYSPPRTVVEGGKRVVLFEIMRSQNPVQVRRRGLWITYCRYGGQVREILPHELMERFHPGVWLTPEHWRLKPESAGVYDVEGQRVSATVRWTVSEQKRLFEWLELPYFQTVLPVPAPVDHLTRAGKLYVASAGWRGRWNELMGPTGVLANFERALDKNFGFAFESWTATKFWLPAVGSTQEYVTSTWIEDLDSVIQPDSDSWALAWILLAGSTLYILDAKIGKDLSHLSMNAIIRFIPNDFPFVSFDQNGAVSVIRLPVREESPFEEKKWGTRVQEQLMLDEPPDNLLARCPVARIESYVGGPPKPRTGGLISRASGLTLINLASGRDALGADVPPLIGNASRIFCHLSSGPSRLNDSNEVRITGLKCKATTFPAFFQDFTTILFDVSIDVNQLSAYKFRPG